MNTRFYDNNLYISIQEANQKYFCSVSTLSRWCKAKKIEAIKAGRYWSIKESSLILFNCQNWDRLIMLVFS